MLWYRHRQVPGRQDTMLVADSRGAHVSKEPDVAKMDANAADMAVAVWNGYVRDLEDMHVSGAPSSKLSRVARTWVSELVAEAGRFYVSLLRTSLVDLFLVHGCMVILKNCEN